MKHNNQKIILKTIYSNNLISRADIAKKLKISKPTVNEHVDDLINKQVVIEVGKGDTHINGGRKPINLAVNHDYKYILALDLNYTKPLIAIGNFSGALVDKLWLDQLIDVDDAISNIQKSISKILSQNQITLHKIAVIVVSMPGVIGKQGETIIYNEQHESLHTMNIISFLKSEYEVPVVFKNDVNMASIAEAKVLEKEGQNMLFVSIGNGLGSGIILKDKLYEGANNAAGEIGYYIDESGKTLDETITIKPLLEQLKILEIDLKKDNITFEDVVLAYQQKNEAVINVIRSLGKKLGFCIHNLLSLIDVETVVIGGDYIVFNDILIEEIESIVNHSRLIHKPIINPSRLNYAGGIIGCLLVGIEFVIDNLK